MIPLNDRLFIERIDPPARIGLIWLPDTAVGKGLLGRIVAKGPGKWIESDFWSVKQPDGSRKWEWRDGYRQPIDYQVGQTVYFNSRWDDANTGTNLHVVQEADIFCIVNDDAPNATATVHDLPLVQSIDPLARPY